MNTSLLIYSRREVWGVPYTVASCRCGWSYRHAFSGAVTREAKRHQRQHAIERHPCSGLVVVP